MRDNGWDYPLQNEVEFLKDFLNVPLDVRATPEGFKHQGIRRVGKAWVQSNREYEAGNPNIFQDAWREVNPLTGLGNNLGSAYTNLQKGNDKTAYVDIALGIASLLTPPTLAKGGSVLLAKGAKKAIQKTLRNNPNLLPVLKGTAAVTAADLSWNKLSEIMNQKAPRNYIDSRMQQDLSDYMGKVKAS